MICYCQACPNTLKQVGLYVCDISDHGAICPKSHRETKNVLPKAYAETEKRCLQNPNEKTLLSIGIEPYQHLA